MHTAGGSHAAVALWITLIALSAAHAVLSFVPSMRLWSLNLHRFLPAWLAWGMWGAAAVALVPPIARAALPAIAAFGGSLQRARVITTLACMAAAAALVWLLPDRVWFVGDFLLRQYTLLGRENMIPTWYPYSLPVDLFIHDTVGRWLMSVGIEAGDVGRVIGAVEAAILAALALRFAQVLELSGAPGAIASAIVFWGGTLTMFTGYNKAFAEMPLVVAAVAVFGLDLVRSGRGVLPLSLALAFGFGLHRSALALVPAALTIVALVVRSEGAAPRRPAAFAALAIPASVLAIMLPRIVGIVLRTDPMHFAPDEVRAAGGVLPSAMAPDRLVDMLNLVVLLAPMALAVPFMVIAFRRRLDREAVVLIALAVPFLLTMPFIHPGQGYWRDWDDFTAMGVALSLLAAWLAGRALEASPRYAWIAVATLLGTALPALQWLVHHADPNRGIARVEAFLSQPPQRSVAQQARTWDFLGWRKTDLLDFDGAAVAFAKLAETEPAPRVLRQWATVEAMRGDPVRAQEIYRRLVERDPDGVRGWFELARLSYEIGDYAESRRAAGELLRLRPGDERALGLIAHLDSLIAER